MMFTMMMMMMMMMMPTMTASNRVLRKTQMVQPPFMASYSDCSA